MAGHAKPHFANDAGHPRIAIGTKQFQCMGARPPFDHPHVFLDMGAGTDIVCPYCSTHYVFDPKLSVTQSEPGGCLVAEPAMAG
ncbi:MAG: zinc-finger domain-containing protein [Pseudomonadota bacterium]